MSVVVPIDNETAKCMEFIFENAEKLPNDFYVNIMDLVKNYREYGNNFYEIHTFLESNKNRVEESILTEIKKFILLPSSHPIKTKWYICFQEINCIRIDSNRYCFTMIIAIVAFLGINGFLGVLIWCIINKSKQ